MIFPPATPFQQDKTVAPSITNYVARVNSYSPAWYLPLSETVGTTATAQVGANGTYVNSPQLGVTSIAQDDASGKSVGLSGVIPSTPHITVTSPLSAASITLMAIIQLDTIANTKQQIITHSGGATVGQLSIEVLQNGQIRCFSDDAANAIFAILGSSGNIPQGTAVQLVYQRQSNVAGWSQRCYVNGGLVAEDTTQRTWPTFAAGTLYIGTWFDGSSFYDPMDGLIAHVAGWNSLLTPAQIVDLSRAQSVAWAIDLDAGTLQSGGTLIYDLAPNGLLRDGLHGRLPLTVSASDGSIVTTTESGNQITIQAGTVISGEYITTPELHGWSSGNTVEQNSDALRAAVANAAQNAASSSTGRGVVELVPGKIYTVRSNGDVSGVRENKAPSVNMASNTELRTQGKPTIASGNQAILKAESWAGKTGLNNRVVVRMEDVDNCVVGWLCIDGNKSSLTNADWPAAAGVMVYTQGGNGALHGLQFYGTTNCRIEQVESRNNISDGFICNNSDITGADTVNLTVTDCWVHHNRRNGMTLVRAHMATPAYDNIVFTRCRFSNQGDDAGLKAEGPGSGADVESDVLGDTIYGVSFIDCEFDNHPGYSLINGVDQGSQQGGGGLTFIYTGGPNGGYYKIINCYMHDNNFNGFRFEIRKGTSVSNVTMQDCVLVNNGSSNTLRLSASVEGGLSPTGHYTNILLKNNAASTIYINPIIPATGHTITIDQDGRGVPISNTAGVQTVTNIP